MTKIWATFRRDEVVTAADTAAATRESEEGGSENVFQ
jgi:hypothetical protein